MAKDKKVIKNIVQKATTTIPEGMLCYQKVGGGSIRFANRIIKSGQKFWIYPESIPSLFKNACKEVPADSKAVVIENQARPRVEGKKELGLVPEKFELVEATDEDGELIKKGESVLYNVVGKDGKPLNEKPLRKAKAEELLSAVNA